MPALCRAPIRKLFNEHPMTGNSSVPRRKAAGRALKGHVAQQHGLVPASAAPCDLDTSRTGCPLHEVDDRCVRLVPLRRARNPNLDPVAVDSDNPRTACVRYDQQIYFHSAINRPNRYSFHGCTVPPPTTHRGVVFVNAVTGTCCPRQMEMSDRCWCEAGSINGQTSPLSCGKNAFGMSATRTHRLPTILAK